MTSDQERAAPAQQPVADVAQKIADECWLDSLQKHTLARRIRKALASSEPELRAEIVRLTHERDELRACEASWEQTRLAIAHMRNENGGLRSRVEALSAEVGKLSTAVLAVVDATRAYLPPDGINAQECLNRILAATDNPTVNPIIAQVERDNGHA